MTVEAAGWAWGLHPPQTPATRAHLPPLIRVCVATAMFWQAKCYDAKFTALHFAAKNGHAPCAESLLKAGAEASLKNKVSDGAAGRGGRHGLLGRGVVRVGDGPCAGAAPRLRAAQPPPPLAHRPRRPPPLLPGPHRRL